MKTRRGRSPGCARSAGAAACRRRRSGPVVEAVGRSRPAEPVGAGGCCRSGARPAPSAARRYCRRRTRHAQAVARDPDARNPSRCAQRAPLGFGQRREIAHAPSRCGRDTRPRRARAGRRSGEQRGLARAGFADDRQHLARPQVEGHVAAGRTAPKRLARPSATSRGGLWSALVIRNAESGRHAAGRRPAAHAPARRRSARANMTRAWPSIPGSRE